MSSFYNKSNLKDDNNSRNLYRSSSRGTSSNSAISRRSLEEETRDRLYSLKLQALNDRLNAQIPRQPAQLPQPNSFDNRDRKIDQLEHEINKARKQHEKLKEQLKFQELERRMTSSISNRPDNPPRDDRFGKMVEMMMLQQTQTQNMILNQMMINNMPQPAPAPVYHPQYPYIYPQHHYQISSPNPVPISKPEFKPDIKPSRTPKFLTNEPLKNSYEYPGNEAQSHMRRLGIAALFCAILKSNYENKNFTLSDSFMFELKIKEIITAIQAYYLSRDMEIYQLFQTILSVNTFDFRQLIIRKDISSDNLNAVTKEFEYFLQNLVSRIVEIMPPGGVLGCETKSLLYEYLQTEQTFPAHYFYSEEQRLFQIDSDNTLHSVGFIESQVLLIGIFIIRALVISVMLKPAEYGLTDNLTTVGMENLRISSTLLVHIYRSLLADYIVQRYPDKTNKNMYVTAEIVELKPELLADQEITAVVKSIKKTIDYCKNTLAKWASVYVSNLKPM